MRTLNFSILFVYLNFNKFRSSDFRVQWNAQNLEKRTWKFRLPSSLERGISLAVTCALHLNTSLMLCATSDTRLCVYILADEITRWRHVSFAVRNFIIIQHNVSLCIFRC